MTKRSPASNFPIKSALGQYIAGDGKDNPDAEIVGVVAHVKHFGLDAVRASAAATLSAVQPGSQQHTSVPRVAHEPDHPHDGGSLELDVRRAQQVQALDPNQPVYNVSTMEQTLDQSLVTQRLSMTLLAFLASLALILAAVGIYGVMSYTVTQRSHEIGIRMAIGAQQRDVFKMVIGRGMMLALIGVAFGLVGCVWPYPVDGDDALRCRTDGSSYVR